MSFANWIWFWVLTFLFALVLLGFGALAVYLGTHGMVAWACAAGAAGFATFVVVLVYVFTEYLY